MNKIVKILRIILLLISIAYIVYFFAKNKEDLNLLLNLDFLFIVLLFFLSFAYQLIHSYRFKVIIEKCGNTKINFIKWFKIFAQTRFLNQFIPQFGNIYRGIALKKTFNIPYTNYISSFTSFLWMDTCFNLSLASIIILIFKPNLTITGINIGIIGSAITIIILTIPFVANKISKKIENFVHKKIWLHSKLGEVINITIESLKDCNYVFKILTIGLLALVRTIIFYYILFLCFGITSNITILIIFYALFKLSSFVVITPGNLGIQELAFGFLSGQLGIGVSEGILVCVVGRFIGTIVIIILGICTGGLDLLIHKKDFQENRISKSLS